MKIAQHGASALSSVRSGRSGSNGGQDMKLRSEVGVGSGSGRVWDVTRKSSVVSGENTPPLTPTATSEVNPTPTPRRPDPPPSRKLRVDVSHWNIRH